MDWVADQLSEKLSFSPYQGTLNIRVDEEETQRILVERGKERLVHRTEGFCDAILVKGSVNGVYDCGVIIPLVEGYDGHLLEIVAPVHLKRALEIEDGDEVILQVDIDPVP